MALGDPLLAMTLTRLPGPQANLAALGVVKAVANFLESPIIMMLHASTALSAGLASRSALWRFMLGLSALLTLAFGLLATPPLYRILLGRVFAVSPEVQQAARAAFLAMLAWPALIAWRRYFQGQLIRQGRGRFLGWASVTRLVAFSIVLALGSRASLGGAFLGALALMAGILVEALAVTVWAQRGELPESVQTRPLPSTVPAVARFYFPLAFTMVAVWGGRALLVAIVARASDATLALAVWPASWGFVILIANATRMVQQLVITHAHATSARVFFQLALVAGLVGSSGLGWLALTASGYELLQILLGGSHSAVGAAARPVIGWSCPVPILVALQNVLQGFCIVAGRSLLINQASVGGTLLTLGVAALLVALHWPGALAAALGIVAGLGVEILCLTGARPWRLAQGIEGEKRLV